MPGIDKNEFIVLFNRMYDNIKHYIYFKTGDIDVADDIAQEVFVKIWEKRDGLRKETLTPLLYTIAGNLCKNRFAHQKVVFDFTNNFQSTEKPETPEFEMEMKEFSDKLQRAIGGLKERNRVVFLMNRIEGFTYNEIAANLEISVKTVEKRMKKALDDLKKTIEYKI